MTLAPGAAGTLRFVARPQVVARHLGQMLIATAVVCAVPAGASLLYGESTAAGRFAIVALLFAVAGAAGLLSPARAALQRNEAMVVAALTFTLPALAMAWPFAAYGLRWDDALFEAISGITTTGLSVLANPETYPPGLIFARAWLQWAGGLGVVVLVLALLTQPGPSGRRLGFGRFEASDIAGGTRAHARRVLAIYLGISAAGCVLLWALEGDAFTALVHTLAAISTGGFAGHHASLAALAPASRWVVLLLCLAGAIAFYSYYKPAYSTWQAVRTDTQLTALLAACLAIVVLLALLDSSGAALPERIGNALALGISAQTTAGFSVVDTATLSSATQLVLIAAMLTGGAVGSTAGGIKILRVVVLVRLVALALARLMAPPSARLSLRVGNEVLERDELESMLAVAGAYGAVLLVSWLVFLLRGAPPLPALFEVSSALATCGLSAGLTMSNLDPVLKAVLCLDMLLGRLEVFALVVLVLPGTWIGRRRSLA